MKLEPVGLVRSAITHRKSMPPWGVPAVLEIFPQFAPALLEIEKHSHLWVLTWLDQGRDERHVLQVTPRGVRDQGPGGLHGVFAVRSPARPNPIGLTATRIERIDGLSIHVDRLDFLDRTPIIDIKPYIRYADAVVDARSGFAEVKPEVQPVMWSVSELPPDPARSIIEQSISLQPQPAYHEDCGREYGTEIAGWRVRWTLRDAQAVVIACEPFE